MKKRIRGKTLTYLIKECEKKNCLEDMLILLKDNKVANQFPHKKIIYHLYTFKKKSIFKSYWFRESLKKSYSISADKRNLDEWEIKVFRLVEK